MISKQLTIVNKLGLHARAATKLVQHTSRYASKTEIKYQDKIVNGKSIMGVMLLAASKGAEIELIISGDDEQEAFRDLAALINDGFGEK